ncbi:MAG: hypothetical protein JW987_01065 [Anaerolineaceae bacterium]|nr:hypothetical protein [Anaerolineaceae bacterium]
MDNKQNKFLMLLKSRKFWAALVGLVMVIVKGYVPDFPVSEDQVLALVMVLVAYILGTGLEDGLTGALRR